MKNVLEWLETTVEKYPDKPAFSDTECSITFAQVYRTGDGVILDTV